MGEVEAEGTVPRRLLRGRRRQRAVGVARVGRDDVGLLLVDDDDLPGLVERNCVQSEFGIPLRGSGAS